MKRTIAQTVIDEMTSLGYKLVGQTRGWYSFRKDDVVVRRGARAGQRLNDGYEIFSK